MDISHYRILVTPTSYGKYDENLKASLEAQVDEVIYNPTGKPLSSKQVTALLPGIDGYIAGLDEIDRKALRDADKLKVIARYGVGVDSVDLQAAREKGIVVTNTPGANSVSVAELSLGLMLALARQFPEAINAAKSGQFPRLSGISLEGKVVGILGLGGIGKQLARRLAGFDCRILAYDPFPDYGFANMHQVEMLSMEQVIVEADFLSLNMPLLSETQNLVNRDFLRKMKVGAFLINTARGEVIDEQAVLEALQSGQLRGAAVDTFIQEPPDPTNPLLQHPRVIATPHLGAQTDGAVNNMGRMALAELLHVLKGEKPQYRVV
jgi:phosphoglycerate dehydrogenase-like enzyme